jgi:hypothetical protein
MDTRKLLGLALPLATAAWRGYHHHVTPTRNPSSTGVLRCVPHPDAGWQVIARIAHSTQSFEVHHQLDEGVRQLRFDRRDGPRR